MAVIIKQIIIVGMLCMLCCSSVRPLIIPVYSPGSASANKGVSVTTAKTIVCQSPEGRAGVRIKEHYGPHRKCENIILCCYDRNYIYISRAFKPVILLPISRWCVDSAWVE